jgi:CRISPR-associated protein Cmr3
MSDIVWYSYDPVDTVLVRGAEEDTTSLMAKFPPPAHTICGAIRTAYLKRHKIAFHDYLARSADQQVYADIGEPSGEAPFSVLGLVFEKDGDAFLPAPAHWYIIKKEDEIDQKYKKHFSDTIFALDRIEKIKGLESSAQLHVWPKNANGIIESLNGMWIRSSDFSRAQKGEEIELYSPAFFFIKEKRVGVALLDDRRVREGRLYSFSHFRLQPGVALLFGIDRQGILDDECMLSLGAEQRFGVCKKRNFTLDCRGTRGELYMALSHIPCTDESREALVCCEKIEYMGGWDLAKGFHKPMRGYYAPGSIFSKNIQNTIAI